KIRFARRDQPSLRRRTAAVLILLMSAIGVEAEVTCTSGCRPRLTGKRNPDFATSKFLIQIKFTVLLPKLWSMALHDALGFTGRNKAGALSQEVRAGSRSLRTKCAPSHE